jgi:hypothetical protein
VRAVWKGFLVVYIIVGKSECTYCNINNFDLMNIYVEDILSDRKELQCCFYGKFTRTYRAHSEELLEPFQVIKLVPN